MAFLAGFCRLSNNWILRKFTGFYVEVFRGTSLIVQLFWLYFALPILFGIHLGNDFWVGAIAIGLNYGEYVCEFVRGSILSVVNVQSEAATALIMSGFQRMRLIIFQKAFRMLLPGFRNH